MSTTMSPLEVLVIKDQIRERYAQYSLLLDGDGLVRSGGKWAELMFTSDVSFRWIAWDGQPVLELNSREELLANMQKGDPKGRHPDEQTTPLQLAFKHYSTGVAFEEVTPTLVKTRNLGLMMSLPKSEPAYYKDSPRRLGDSVPVVWAGVYHDTWRIEGGIWKKAVTVCYTAPAGDLMEGGNLRTVK